MPREERAKQFMPFDPLKGYRDALKEKERIVVEKIELSEERKEELDFKLSQMKKMDLVTVVYFQKEEYIKVTGTVSKIDHTSHILKIVNQKIPIQDIADIEIHS